MEVVSYNVLTPPYANAASYPLCDPLDLVPATRLKRVWAQLLPHVEAGSVLCLQELSIGWADELQVLLHAHDYTLLVAHYGVVRSGQMGLGLAFPRAKYTLARTNRKRVAATKRWFPEPPVPGPNFLVRSGRALSANFWWLLRRPVAPPPKWADETTQTKASWRVNDMLFAELREKTAAARAFCVATYHMPCDFQFPRVMTVHAALCLQETQRLAGALPYVLAGDFNFTPGSAPYRLVTEGDLARDDPAYPDLPAEDPWTVKLAHPVRSAYVTHTGAEPGTTNHCVSGHGNAAATLFEGTLDYLFYRGLRVTGTLPLPSVEELASVKSFPTAAQPSDHLKIAATFAFADEPAAEATA